MSDGAMDEMHSRNQTSPVRTEPKVIAIAATRPAPSSALVWASGIAVLAYMGCVLLFR
jgi:hypothetical protein